jgi:hypothetical protein
MINRILTLFSLTIVSVLSSAAQTPITFKNNWMYVDASLSYGGNNIPVQAMIDTGCTYCVIDSAFAATSAIISRDSVLISYSTEKSPLQVPRVYISELTVGNKVYSNLYCYVINLQKQFKQYSPLFIIGADILSRDLWSFDLKNLLLVFPSELPQHYSIIAWERKKARYPNEIILQAKVQGKKSYFFLDTGSRNNLLPMHLGIKSTGRKVLEKANVSTELTKEENSIVEQANFQIGIIHTKLDFVLNTERMGYLNIDFLKEKSFVLDYKKGRIILP